MVLVCRGVSLGYTGVCLPIHYWVSCLELLTEFSGFTILLLFSISRKILGLPFSDIEEGSKDAGWVFVALLFF